MLINNIEVAMDIDNSTSYSDIFTDNKPYYLGCRIDGYSNDLINFYYGNIGEVKILKFIDEANSVLSHYKFNAGDGDILYDHSGNGNHGALMNMDESSWVLNTDFESLTISPLSLDFGEVRLGESADLDVEFCNTDDEELNVNITRCRIGIY